MDTHTIDHSVTAKYKLFYTLSVVSLALLLSAMAWVVYTLVITPPEEPASVMRFIYLIVLTGFIVLAAQALLVSTRFIAMVGRDQETIARLKHELEQVEVLDPLTRVFNRYKFDSVITRELENVRRYGNPLTGIIFDLDDFRAINEVHGYQAGDKLLANLAQFVNGKLRNSDYVFRWRGGKFIILAPHTSIDDAALVAEKLRELVGHKLFGGKIRLTLSLGVIQAQDSDTLDIFIRRIQSALTGAKHQGRNCVVVART